MSQPQQDYGRGQYVPQQYVQQQYAADPQYQYQQQQVQYTNVVPNQQYVQQGQQQYYQGNGYGQVQGGSQGQRHSASSHQQAMIAAQQAAQQQQIYAQQQFAAQQAAQAQAKAQAQAQARAQAEAQAAAQAKAQAKKAAAAKAQAQAAYEKQESQKAQQQKDKAKKKKHKRRHQAKKNRKVGRWYLGETLGKGGYSWVKKGYDRQDGRVVALKFTSKAKGNWSDSQSKQVQNEIEALRQIKHKHVLQLLAYNLNAKYPQKDNTVIPTVLLVLEYLPGGELFDILYYTHALKEDIARTYFHQLMDGLSACHNAGICHRDIKPQNLLLDSHFALKIADFGLAKVFDKEDENVMRTFYVGTRGYQAPEILDKEPYSFACDIFSCGVVLFILLAGYPPFEAATSKCRWYAPLAAGNAREFWKQHRGCGIPSPAKDLITRMLWYDKDKRITISGIKKHKWFNGEKLSAKSLIKELKTLHRKMEVERRNDATKQGQLQNSIHRPLDMETAWIYDTGRQEVQFQASSASAASGLATGKANGAIDQSVDDAKTGEPKDFQNGDTITSCAELFKVILISLKAKEDIDCTGIISQKFLDSDKKELHCNNITRSLVEMYSDKNEKWKKIKEAGDAKIMVNYSTKEVECVAPVFPEDDTISFKDVFTQAAPKFVLHFIHSVITELGGEATCDFEECSIEAKLATHNFPAPVFIAVRIYFSEEYSSHVVRFDRISGDVLHFARVLRKLVPQCGYVLTGLSDDQYNAVEEKQAQKGAENEDFLNEFNIDNAVAIGA